MTADKQSYDRITIHDKDGNTRDMERPLFGDLTMHQDGGRSVIETTDWLGNTKTYVPAQDESIEATRY